MGNLNGDSTVTGVPAVAGAHKADGIGVHGTSSTGFGVRGDGEGPGAAVVGVNNSATPGNGGWFESAEGEGVRGWSKNPNHGGVVGVNTGGGNGGFFESAEGEGVRGWSKNPNHGAVVGVNTGGGASVYGLSENANSIVGESRGTGAGVVGVNNSATPGNGGWFESAEGEGVRGWSKNPNHGGVVGVNTGGGNGGFFESAEGEGVRGWSKNPNHGAVVGVNTGGGDAGNFQGNVYVTGNITVRGDLLLEGADYAEALSTTDAAVEAGLVVVLGADGEVHPCTSDYDTAVAGIVSGAGGVKPAIVLDRHDNSAHVALMGKVWCAADADMAPIRPGDLLTTSATSGHCRRVTEPERAFGAVIGKALTSLSSGQGYVRVLVSPR
ncbi:hypothetical protein DFR70_11329 [Nocardia tenerifensis]|uniref:Uncharacterized protein n=1 Tax=Nocardia tenerifensis TaxID=228006 RepID=A0A318K5Z2_9NOCA|nr:hypothetical protein [Nocardia tenerifensis]PXX58694.1 hypothetical protein DFR70_11329 [Nocardia tenerifensis]